MSYEGIITGGKTVFENKLWDGLLSKVENRSFVDRANGRPAHIYPVKTDHGNYEFSVEGGGINRGLPKVIKIMGPVFGRSQKSHGVGYLGALHILTGKITGPSSQRDKDSVETAVDAFLRKYADGTALSQLGWDVLMHEGWAAILKRPRSGEGYKKEVAILAAAMPKQAIDEYTPTGKRKLEYPEYQDLKIPPSIYSFVRKTFEKEGIFNDLYKSYMTVNRRVSAWEDGPGHKYFHAK